MSTVINLHRRKTIPVAHRGNIFLSKNILGFEEKETEGEQKDEGIRGHTKAQFLQDGPNFPAGTTSDALRGLSGGKKITGEKAGPDDQKNFDQNAF